MGWVEGFQFLVAWSWRTCGYGGVKAQEEGGHWADILVKGILGRRISKVGNMLGMLGSRQKCPPWLTWNMLRLEKQQGSLCEDLAYASSERKRSTRGFGGSEK